MRLVALRLKRYRRFEQETTLDLTPRVVALVGPNEAGKSTILDALESIGDPEAVREFKDAEFTGRVRPDDDTTMVSALYELEADDRKALEDIPGAPQVRLFYRARSANGQASSDAIPAIKRPVEPRGRLSSLLERVLENRSKQLSKLRGELVVMADLDDGTQEESGAEAVEWTVGELLKTVLGELQQDDDTLSDEARRNLLSLGNALRRAPSSAPLYVRESAELAVKVSHEHGEEHPRDQVREVLRSKFPVVRVLRDRDRELLSSYGFEEHTDAPDPLENLLGLAELEWSDLKEAAAVPGNPVLASLLKRGNRNLEGRLHGSWKQALVSVELEVQGGALHLFPYDASSETHSRIEDRSDGFRSFLSMLAFTSRHSTGDRKLLLAIDEAERHLHYNAQADLVDVLTRQQKFATQVVYTTHSAGCLPEDLGSAIRVVKPDDGDRSSIKNGFWSAQAKERYSGGFTSLLMAMGADAVAFTPARHAVITEGPSDALLLPALLRAALGKAADWPLALQVAGGLAWTPPRRLSKLEAEAAHVVYLTDSDEEGEKYRSDLEEAGVDDARIFSLPPFSPGGLSIEDFVHPETLTAVMAALLERLRDYKGDVFDGKPLPDGGVARALEDWQRERGIRPISKTAVAEHVLRLSRTNLAYMYWDPGEEGPLPLAHPARTDALVVLYSQLRTALQIGDP